MNVHNGYQNSSGTKENDSLDVLISTIVNFTDIFLYALSTYPKKNLLYSESSRLSSTTPNLGFANSTNSSRMTGQAPPTSSKFDISGKIVLAKSSNKTNESLDMACVRVRKNSNHKSICTNLPHSKSGHSCRAVSTGMLRCPGGLLYSNENK